VEEIGGIQLGTERCTNELGYVQRCYGYWISVQQLDAYAVLEHVCRIHRIIRTPRGNALLIGMGGSGRSSLARLATFIAGYKRMDCNHVIMLITTTVTTIEITKFYGREQFHEDLRKMYRIVCYKYYLR